LNAWSQESSFDDPDLAQPVLCARLDFDDALDDATLERAWVDIDADLRRRFPELTEIFLEPVPRADPVVRNRVLERYGRAGVDRPRDGPE
jgi:hypothetical protein